MGIKDIKTNIINLEIFSIWVIKEGISCQKYSG
jgi:hypothetical protein